MIIEQTCNLLKIRYGREIETLTISGVRIGLHLTAIRLSDGSTGTSATIQDDQPFLAKSSRDFGDFSPLRIEGQKVLTLLETNKEAAIIRSLKMAVMNAISSRLISTGGYNIVEDLDPIQLLDPGPNTTVTIIGAFHSYIRKMSETSCRLFVLEMNEGALPQEYKKFFIPASKYKRVLPSSDVVIITGQTLVNGTIDELLGAIVPATRIIVTGPSCSIIPDILFENGVNIIGGVRITKPDLLFDLAGEGGAGYHLFEHCAQKICMLKQDEAQIK